MTKAKLAIAVFIVILATSVALASRFSLEALNPVIAPLETSLTAKETAATEVLGLKVANEVMASNVGPVARQQPTSRRLALLPTVYAVTGPSCAGNTLLDNFVETYSFVFNVGDNQPTLPANEYCFEGRAKGVIEYSLYRSPEPLGALDYAVKVVMDLRITGKVLDPNNCDKTTPIDLRIKGEVVFLFEALNDDFFVNKGGGPNTKVPVGYKLVCISRIMIDKIGGRINKDKCPYCVRTQGAGTTDN